MSITIMHLLNNIYCVLIMNHTQRVLERRQGHAKLSKMFATYSFFSESNGTVLSMGIK